MYHGRGIQRGAMVMANSFSYAKCGMRITHDESIYIVHRMKGLSHLRIILQIAEHILTHQFNLLQMSRDISDTKNVKPESCE
jgi:hypothetical protein